MGRCFGFDFAVHKILRHGRSVELEHEGVCATGSVKRPCFQSCKLTVQQKLQKEAHKGDVRLTGSNVLKKL